MWHVWIMNAFLSALACLCFYVDTSCLHVCVLYTRLREHGSSCFFIGNNCVCFVKSSFKLNWKSGAFVLHVCECVSSLSHRLMGTRRIHAEGLPGAWSQAFYMETVRNRYVSRLRHSLLFHSHTCAFTHTHTHTSKVHLIFSPNMPTLSSSFALFCVAPFCTL